MMFSNKAVVKLIVAIELLFVVSTTIHAADTIYQDTFTGTGINLNGTIPDVSLNNNAWAAGPNIKDNGTLTGTAFSAFLPFQPQPDTIYTLSAELKAISTTANNANWIALGFTQTQSSLTARWSDAPGQPVAWALSRSNMPGTNFDTSFLGFGAAPPAPTAGNVAAPT